MSTDLLGPNGSFTLGPAKHLISEGFNKGTPSTSPPLYRGETGRTQWIDRYHNVISGDKMNTYRVISYLGIT